MTAGAERSPSEILEEWNRRAWVDCDLDVVDELVAEPLIRHGLNGTTKRSRDEMKHDLCQYQKAIGRPIVEVRDQVVAGDKVWCRTHMRGANLETGETRSVERLLIYRIEGGQIAEIWALTATDVDWQA